MASTLLTTTAYDAAKVKLYIGTERVTGFSSDTKITVTRNNDLVMPKVGTDGEVSLALSRDRTGTMEVNLQTTSSFNDWLSVFVRQADTTGLVFFPVILEGSQGPYLTAIGWVQGVAPLSYGSEVGDMNWTFGLLDCWLAPDAGSSILNAIGNVVQGITGTSF